MTRNQDLIEKAGDNLPEVPNGEEEGMSFLDHLEELRWHLVRSTLAVVIIVQSSTRKH